jgi:uncharacterized protein YdaT
LKNLEEPVKKKAIEIANAMMDEGYEEGRAIPIAVLLRAGFFHYSGLISAFRFVIVFHQLIDFFFRSVMDEGYEEGRAIPIATSQAKEWKKNASKEEIDQLMKSHSRFQSLFSSQVPRDSSMIADNPS